MLKLYNRLQNRYWENREFSTRILGKFFKEFSRRYPPSIIHKGQFILVRIRILRRVQVENLTLRRGRFGTEVGDGGAIQSAVLLLHLAVVAAVDLPQGLETDVLLVDAVIEQVGVDSGGEGDAGVDNFFWGNNILC